MNPISFLMNFNQSSIASSIRLGFMTRRKGGSRMREKTIGLKTPFLAVENLD
jgi:hypothetical protein